MNPIANLQAAREAVDAAFFAEEAEVVRDRLEQCRLGGGQRERIAEHAAGIVRQLRADPSPDLMETFLSEYGPAGEHLAAHGAPRG